MFIDEIDCNSRLYKYKNFNERTISSLVGDKVYFSDPLNFNDPLDVNPCIEVDVDEEDLEEILCKMICARRKELLKKNFSSIFEYNENMRKYVDENSRKFSIEEINKIIENFEGDEISYKDYLKSSISMELRRIYNFGIFCLSEINDCPLMWSHYAQNHKGICIGYSLRPHGIEKIIKISYGGDRNVKASHIKNMLEGKEDARRMIDNAVLGRKAEAWKYEREWRLIGTHGEYSSPLKMEEIIFGYKCEADVKFSLYTILQERKSPIKFFEAYVPDGSFSIKIRDFDLNDITEFPHSSIDPHNFFDPLT